MPQLANKDSYVELREKKEELVRSERLAFTGRIAASIAHEIRNPLGNVSMSVRQLKNVFRSGSPWAKHIEVIIRNTERINFLITELLNCARPPELNIQPCNIHEILETALEATKATISAQPIKIVKKFSPKLSVINIDKEQIKRVFSNLMINAAESMPQGGRMTIVTEVDGNFFIVKTQDTGEGIPEEDIIRIFDPFFSTKSWGVGLGLSICYGIVASHGGTIAVESETNKGTTFTISLPIK